MQHDIENGLIKITKHPAFPLDIYNYTERAQYSKKWNKATTASRGLIVHRNTGEIIARPFAKFFNYEERPNSIGLTDPVLVTDKMDGSLGIMYQAVPGSKTVPRIATRGSFMSDQAKHASNVLGERYPDFYPREGYTYLFEIVYPENRIVLDYGDTDDLFLLGAVEIETGKVIAPQMLPDWRGPRVGTLTAQTFQEALSIGPRAGKEGLVVRSLNTDTMVKIKQEDYIRLHRIVTGLNQRTVWEMLKDGLNPYEGIPDELHDWVSNIAANLQAAFDGAKKTAESLFNHIIDHLNEEVGLGQWGRKDFALEAQKYLGWAQKTLFLQLDNQPIDEYIWKVLRPNGEENSYAR
jgi:RNA ligase